MPNPCGTVHMPDFPCRECDRIRAKEERDGPEGIVVSGGSSVVEPPDGAGNVSSESEVQPEAQKVPERCPVDDSVAPGSKSDRLAVAQESVAETLARYRAKNAARQKRYRERAKRKSDG